MINDQRQHETPKERARVAAELQEEARQLTENAMLAAPSPQTTLALSHGNGNGHGASAKVYKLTRDPRVTAVGQMLRRTSLDELPQLLNILRGEMSLVGPRPPVLYELEHYQEWHKGRLDVKPGLTGLWQVSGRSRTKFDEMVRLDLRYCRSWSLWLDLKILMATPRAVLSGRGAY